MSFLFTKTPVLANVDNTYDLYNNFPTGLLILEKEILSFNEDFKIHSANLESRRLLQIPKDNNIQKFVSRMKNFKEYNTLTQKETNSTLYDHIFNQNQFLFSKELGKTFISPSSYRILVYVKVKYYHAKILISVDNYQEEHKNMQSQFIKTIGYEYLLTLYHEINNPLNSLMGTISDIISCGICSIINKKRIELLLCLIQTFLKHFILYFQVKTMSKNDISGNKSTVNLENLFKGISKKFSKIFCYKNINITENFSGLSGHNMNINYFYFKNLIKMIYFYLYHKNEKGGQFVVSSERLQKNNKKLKIIFSNGNISDLYLKTYSSLSENDKYVNSNPEKKIQTQNMIEEQIFIISNYLDIKVDISSRSQPLRITIVIDVIKDNEFGNEMELSEFDPEFKSKISSLQRDISRKLTKKTVELEPEYDDEGYLEEDELEIKKPTDHNVNGLNNKIKFNVSDDNENECDENEEEKTEEEDEIILTCPFIINKNIKHTNNNKLSYSNNIVKQTTQAQPSTQKSQKSLGLIRSLTYNHPRKLNNFNTVSNNGSGLSNCGGKVKNNLNRKSSFSKACNNKHDINGTTNCKLAVLAEALKKKKKRKILSVEKNNMLSSVFKAIAKTNQTPLLSPISSINKIYLKNKTGSFHTKTSLFNNKHFYYDLDSNKNNEDTKSFIKLRKAFSHKSFRERTLHLSLDLEQGNGALKLIDEPETTRNENDIIFTPPQINIINNNNFTNNNNTQSNSNNNPITFCMNNINNLNVNQFNIINENNTNNTNHCKGESKLTQHQNNEQQHTSEIFTVITLNPTSLQEQVNVKFPNLKKRRLHPPTQKKNTDVDLKSNKSSKKQPFEIQFQLSDSEKHPTTSLKRKVQLQNDSLLCKCNDVLLVDDEQFNIGCMATLLKKFKIESDVCFNGEDCVKKFEAKLIKMCKCDKTVYKLILMDVIMPTMNGFEAANKIQSIINNNNFLNTKRISIVFVSACVNQQNDFEEIRKRLPIVKDFFTKPLKLNKIQEILDKYYYDNNLIIDS